MSSNDSNKHLKFRASINNQFWMIFARTLASMQADPVLSHAICVQRLTEQGLSYLLPVKWHCSLGCWERSSRRESKPFLDATSRGYLRMSVALSLSSPLSLRAVQSVCKEKKQKPLSAWRLHVEWLNKLICTFQLSSIYRRFQHPSRHWMTHRNDLMPIFKTSYGLIYCSRNEWIDWNLRMMHLQQSRAISLTVYVLRKLR